MKRFASFSLLALLFLPGCGITQTLPEAPQRSGEMPQFGVNFIRYIDSPRADIYKDFDTLGVQAFRQLTSADIGWKSVEPQKGRWNFHTSDDAIMNATAEPIVTLFSLQYSSGTPPWATATTPFEKEVGADAKEYVETVVKRYKDYVKYWEIGNEMDHWRAADPGATPRPQSADKLPPTLPENGFSPEEQGVFFKQVAELIRANDPDAVIVMPGMGGISEYTWGTWLPGVLQGAGKDTFDVINYHFYSPWYQLGTERRTLQTKLQALGVGDKPVWLTETGSTSSPTLTIRTNYPNSETTQAADVFRRALLGFANGDGLVLWHTYIGSPSASDNDWRDYGLISSDGKKKPAYSTFKLFADELLPLQKVETQEENPAGVNAYKIIKKDGTVKYVAWGKGNWSVPQGVTAISSILSGPSGAYQWSAVPKTITLSDVPVILK